MAFRKIKDDADAEACLRAAEASGLPRSAWAWANGIDARSLNIWRVIRAHKHDRGRVSPPLRMVELAPPLGHQLRSTSSRSERGSSRNVCL